MTEADFPLKLLVGRWFWRMGSATLLRVPLSAYEAKPSSGKIIELTDLDALGIEVAGDFRIRYRVAECKSGKVGARELFWLKGVSTFFESNEAYLAIAHDRTRTVGMRELAARLDLGLITAADLEQLLEHQGDSPDRPDAVLFDSGTLNRSAKLLDNIDRDLAKLADYNLRLFWQVPHHRNLQLGVAYLAGSRAQLDPTKRTHLALFAEHVFRYCLALFATCEAVLKRGAPAIADHLPAYLHGGERGFREMQRLMEAARRLQQQLEADERPELEAILSPLPPYYDELLELVTRLLRRPSCPTAILRHLQAASLGAIAAGARVPDVLEDYDELAVKLSNDVVAFLVRASGIDPQFAGHMQAALTGENRPRLQNGSALKGSVDTSADADVEAEARRHTAPATRGQAKLDLD